MVYTPGSGSTGRVIAKSLLRAHLNDFLTSGDSYIDIREIRFWSGQVTHMRGWPDLQSYYDSLFDSARRTARGEDEEKPILRRIRGWHVRNGDRVLLSLCDEWECTATFLDERYDVRLEERSRRVPAEPLRPFDPGHDRNLGEVGEV